jgi:hypothetical protein
MKNLKPQLRVLVVLQRVVLERWGLWQHLVCQVLGLLESRPAWPQ